MLFFSRTQTPKKEREIKRNLSHDKGTFFLSLSPLGVKKTKFAFVSFFRHEINKLKFECLLANHLLKKTKNLNTASGHAKSFTPVRRNESTNRFTKRNLFVASGRDEST